MCFDLAASLQAKESKQAKIPHVGFGTVTGHRMEQDC